jgi:hypothetical protein
MVDVKQAAAVLGVSERRVRQLVAAGSLPAARFAGRLDVDAAALRRPPRKAGRPLALRAAWALAVMADGRDAAWLSPKERYRAKERLESLRRDPDPVAAVVAWMVHRSRRIALWARDAEPLRDDARLVPSGVSDPRAGMVAAQYVEAYVRDGDLDALAADYDLLPPAGRPANVILHAAPLVPDQPVPLLFLVADLADYGPGRELGRSRELLEAWRAPR